MFNWKINIDNGNSFVVESEIRNISEFIESIMGTTGKKVISVLPLANEKEYFGDNKGYTSNGVCIMSNKVSSIEFYDRNYPRRI